MWNAERRSEKLQIEKENKIVELDKIQKNLEKELSLYFSKSTMNEIYQKIDPHDVMKRLEYHLSFNDAQKVNYLLLYQKVNQIQIQIIDP